MTKRDKSGTREETDSDKDRKSTRLNSSHGYISYAVFCLKKKKKLIVVVYKQSQNYHLSPTLALTDSERLYNCYVSEHACTRSSEPRTVGHLPSGSVVSRV